MRSEDERRREDEAREEREARERNRRDRKNEPRRPPGHRIAIPGCGSITIRWPC